jgi:hypothetical protein
MRALAHMRAGIGRAYERARVRRAPSCLRRTWARRAAAARRRSLRRPPAARATAARRCTAGCGRTPQAPASARAALQRVARCALRCVATQRDGATLRRRRMILFIATHDDRAPTPPGLRRRARVRHLQAEAAGGGRLREDRHARQQRALRVRACVRVCMCARARL